MDHKQCLAALRLPDHPQDNVFLSPRTHTQRVPSALAHDSNSLLPSTVLLLAHLSASTKMLLRKYALNFQPSFPPYIHISTHLPSPPTHRQHNTQPIHQPLSRNNPTHIFNFNHASLLYPLFLLCPLFPLQLPLHPSPPPPPPPPSPPSS